MGTRSWATVILDRLLHHATILTMRGESYRLKDKKRTEAWDPTPTVPAPEDPDQARR